MELEAYMGALLQGPCTSAILATTIGKGTQHVVTLPLEGGLYTRRRFEFCPDGSVRGSRGRSS